MHLIVTGATGFIGRAVVKTALAQGHAVTALVRDVAKAESLLGAHADLNVVLCKDIADGFPVGILKGDDALVHLAWAEVGKYTDPSNLFGNLEPQYKFIMQAVEQGLRNITVAGSCLEYGLQEGAAGEGAGATPVTFYGLAKKTLYDMLVLSLPQDAALKWLRYFYVYGPGQRPGAVIPQLLRALEAGEETFNMSKGDQVRDFVHVDTVAANTVCIALQNDVTGIINIGSGAGLRVDALVETILKEKKRDIKLNKGFYGYPSYEPFAFWADTTKLQTIKGTKIDEKINL